MRRTAFALALFAFTVTATAAEIPSPADHFGHMVGADRTLIPYPDVLDYLDSVAARYRVHAFILFHGVHNDAGN